MQWTKGKNLGFSDAFAEELYLPVDPAEDAPTVETQQADPDSLLNTVKAVLKLRHAEEDLQADGEFSVVCSEPDRPFVYRRGALLLAVNPNGGNRSAEIGAENRECIFVIGEAELENGVLTLGPQSFAVFR